MSITHSKVSSQPDSGDADLVQPSDWNDDHTIVATSAFPGYEFDYAQITSGNVSITATTEGTANTVVTGNAVAYDGSTRICIEFYAPISAIQATSGCHLICFLYDGSSSIGYIWQATNNANVTLRTGGVYAKVFLTPSAATKTYSIRAITGSGTSTIGSGAGGNGAYYPAFIRITKA